MSDKRNKFESAGNQLVITAQGDSLENGFWQYEPGPNEVSSSGNFDEGFRIDSWMYKTPKDTVNITWQVLEKDSIKLNVPSLLGIVSDEEPPVIFQARIDDGDSNTYVVLLRYDLAKLNSSVYDYLYQYNSSLENDSLVKLISKEFKKFTFKKREVFRSIVETEKARKYVAISYIFVVDEFLYDFTYKNYTERSDDITAELFKEMLYTLECNQKDLFSYGDRKFLKEENVEFTAPDSGVPVGRDY